MGVPAIMRPFVIPVVLSAWAIGPAHAHHSSVPWYDLNADQITVTGVVKEFQFINPHVHVIIDVTSADGTVEEWRLESTSRNRMVRIGWTEESIKPGQTVTATGFPAWKGNGIDTEEIIVDDGALVWRREQAALQYREAAGVTAQNRIHLERRDSWRDR